MSGEPPINADQAQRIIELLEDLLTAVKAGGVPRGGGSSAPASGGGGHSTFKEGVFTGWKAVRITFGFDKGVQLGDLGAKGFEYFFNNWTPREPIKPEDAALQNALAEAEREIKSGAFVPLKYTNKPFVPKDGRPAHQSEGAKKTTSPPARREHVPPDEDAPF